MAVAELDPLMTWLPEPRPSRPMHDVDDVLAIARAVRPDVISVLVPPPSDRSPLDLARTAASFGELCDRAAEDGLRLAIEPFAWSALGTLADAWTVVREAGRTNGGLVFDVWHHARRGGTIDDLRAIDSSRIWAVQLADAPLLAGVAGLAEECRSGRLWPGDGELPLAEYLGALRTGGCRAPLGVEVFGDAGADAAGRARRAFESISRIEARASLGWLSMPDG